MGRFWKKTSRLTHAEKVIRHEDKARNLRRALPLVAMILLVCLAALCVLLIERHLKDSHDRKLRRNEVLKELDERRKMEEREKQRYILLQTDSEFFETIARDKNGMGLPGETIIRIKHDEDAPIGRERPAQEQSSTPSN